ncbi:MAG: type 1 glutamine amidotransferase domain-containing protein [Myxococcales bacterium]|jgi:protease I
MARIAMLVGEDFEDVEFRKPFNRLKQRGHTVELLGAREGHTVHGKRGEEKVDIERAVSNVDPQAYDALVIPGGYGPDHLRMDHDVVDFVRRFGRTQRPIAAVCHGPQLLIEADLVRDRTVTSWPSVKTDLENAGARWVNETVVQDGPLITSRNPDDLDAFVDALQQRLQPGAHAKSA